jgi:hypothetical protein
MTRPSGLFTMAIIVMAVLVTATHVLFSVVQGKTWMPGTSPGMTSW